MSLRQAWDENAEHWIRWVRRPGHDSYDQFHGKRFLSLLPPPGRLTVDLGAGEGRLSRDLLAAGHRVVALDGSPTLAHACANHPTALPATVADAAALPLRSSCADLVVAFMSLQDVDDLASAISESARVLLRGGRLCLAIVHPINSAGSFGGEDTNAPFVIAGSYLSTFRYHDDIVRDGLPMTFHSEHRPLQAYADLLEESGLLIESIREVSVDDQSDHWSRIPLFLHIRAVRS
jgi:ubiquinone/menaquinone biosynthesis C-methylase UbiE